MKFSSLRVILTASELYREVFGDRHFTKVLDTKLRCNFTRTDDNWINKKIQKT